jgi:zinc transport system ATP-binding protein
MSDPIIEICDLNFSYGKTLILEAVNLTIRPKEFIGVFGPNGGGKTTFLKILMGFLKPDRGRVLLFGKPPKSGRKKIGYVPQVARFDRAFPISVLELVLMGCLSQLRWWGSYTPHTREKARAALAKVGLLEKQDQPFGTLSGGQAQRALIARALVHHPEVLLLDEPTASVDPQAEKEIYQLLEALKKEMTIIMVTHDLQSIMDKAERLLCIHRHVTAYQPKTLCEHFMVGLYHTPPTP